MIDGLILQLGGIPGGPEVLLVLLLAVLLFGANKIPKLARSTGQAMGEFQKGRQQVEEELEQMQEGGTVTSDSGAESASTEPSSTESTSTETESNSDAETTSESSSN